MTVRLPGGGLAVRKRLRDPSTATEDVALRLVREGEHLLMLAGVPGVLRCLALDRHAPALLLEYAPGGTLARALASGETPGVGRRLPWAAVRDVAGTLGATLAAVHAAGVVHRDVKPSNLLVGADGRLRLADFGVAARAGSCGTFGDGWIEDAVGTLGYAAPEQLAGAGRPVHPSADVYAFGVVLYELATGRLPYELAPGEDEVALRARITAGARPLPPTAHRPELGREVDRVLLAALATDPGRRPAGAAALARAWDAAWTAARRAVAPNERA